MGDKLANFDSGPYLVVAVFSEAVLQEQDGVASLIRIVDRTIMRVTGTAVPEEMPPFERRLNLYLSFKSGDARGTISIKVTRTLPSGLTDNENAFETGVHFEGGNRGHNLNLQLQMRFTEPGIYWFNVYVDDRLATRTPFEVIYLPTRGPAQMQTQ